MVAKFEDKKLTCEECGTEFVWDKSEQAYFAKKGFQKVPKRCRACRAERKSKEQEEKAREKEIVCAKCGKKGTINQEISSEEETLCLECYKEERK